VIIATTTAGEALLFTIDGQNISRTKVCDNPLSPHNPGLWTQGSSFFYYDESIKQLNRLAWDSNSVGILQTNQLISLTENNRLDLLTTGE